MIHSPIFTEVTVGAAAGFLAASGWAYAANWPTSQIFGRTLVAPRRLSELALTFDDGPNPAWTPRLLEILAANNICATFFMVGKYAQSQTDLVREVLAAGHLVGNHTWSHPNLALTASTIIEEELTRTSEVLEQITGAPVRYFRPPFGARRPFVLRTARKLGMIPVTWNAMTSDWKEPSADAIARRLMNSIDSANKRGWAANIVLHDGNHRQQGANRSPSISAVSRLIEHYKATHRFVTLDAWS